MAESSVAPVATSTPTAPAVETPTLDKQSISTDGPSDSDLNGMDAAELEAAAKKGEISKEQAKDLKKKLKLKVYGQDVEAEYDLGDEEMLKREFQKSKSFDKLSKDSSEFQKQVDGMLKMLKENPADILEKLGLDVDDFAEKRLTKKLEEMKKSPEQLEKELMQKELEDLRQEKKAAKEAQEAADHERLKGQAMQQITEEISGALDKSKSFLPRKPKIMQRVAETMMFAMQNGFSEVTAADVIPIVEKQFEQEMNEYFGDAPEEVIERLAGKEALTRYRKSIYQKNKSTPAPDKKVVETGKGSDPVEEKMSIAEQRRRFQKMFR